MATVVVDATSELQSIVSGKPPELSEEIKADNAAQAEAKGTTLKGTPDTTLKPRVLGSAPKTTPKPGVVAEAERVVEAPKEDEDDGLTPEQRAEFTKQMKKTIGRAHGKMKEAEEFAAEQYNTRRLAEQRAAELERQLAELQSKVNPPQSKGMDEPKRANFETDEAYQSAVIDWKVDQRIQERERQLAQQAAEEQQNRILEAAKQRIAKAVELIPDYTEVVGSQDVPVPPHIAAYMQESELFAELGYHFAQHPDVLEKLSKMPHTTRSDVIKVGIAIGKVEDILQPFSSRSSAASAEKVKDTEQGAGPAESPKASAPSVKTESATGASPSSTPRAAAPVIRPVPTGSGTQVEKDPSERSYAEDKEAWARQRRVNLGLRKRH